MLQESRMRKQEKWRTNYGLYIPAVSQHRVPSHTSSANSARGTQRNCVYRPCALSGELSAAERHAQKYNERYQYRARPSAAACLPLITPEYLNCSNKYRSSTKQSNSAKLSINSLGLLITEPLKLRSHRIRRRAGRGTACRRAACKIFLTRWLGPISIFMLGGRGLRVGPTYVMIWRPRGHFRHMQHGAIWSRVDNETHQRNVRRRAAPHPVWTLHKADENYACWTIYTVLSTIYRLLCMQTTWERQNCKEDIRWQRFQRQPLVLLYFAVPMLTIMCLRCKLRLFFEKHFSHK